MSFYVDSVAQGAQGANQLTVLTAEGVVGEDVQSGQIAVRRGDGKLSYAVDPAIPGASLRPISQDADITLGQQSAPVVFTGALQGRMECVMLATGNLALIWCSGYNVQIQITDPHGVALSSVKVIEAVPETAGNPSLVSGALLTNGNVVVLYGANGPKFAIYDPIGAFLVVAPTAIEVVQGICAQSICALTSGNFAVCYSRSTNSDIVKYAVYAADGTVVKMAAALRSSPTTNLTSAASAITALSGGGFVCAYALNNAGTVTTYFQRFDGAGNYAGAETVIRSGVTSPSGVAVRGLPLGNFVVVESADVRVNWYTAAGVQAGSPTSLDAGIVRNVNIGINQNVDGAIIGWMSNPSSVVKAALINSVGGFMHIVVTDSAVSWFIEPPLVTFEAKSVNAVAYINATTKCVTVATYAAGFVATGKKCLSALQVPDSGRVSLCRFVSSPVAPSAITIMLATQHLNGNGTYMFLNQFVPRCKPVGVFTSSAVVNGTATYQFAGVATLRTAFVDSYSTDIFPAGQKLSVQGKTALMHGVTK